MRYGKDIVKRIVSELQKVPNIRHVCNKVGIDHSTFYRWMMHHFEFYQYVEAALIIGRRHINDAAESVIISGIQNGDMRSSMYWLAHNKERYIDEKRVKYYQYLEQYERSIQEQEIPDESTFEKLFEYRFDLESAFGSKFSDKYSEPLINIICRGDENLKEVFRSAYAEWKENKLSFNELEKKTEPIKKFAQDLDSLDQSVIN